MRVLVTSGGTREPIDDVRYVSNVASGRTGAWIAEEAVRRYHTVLLLSGMDAVQPADWALNTGLVQAQRFGPTAQLLELAEEAAATGIDAIVATAAVSDFAPRPQAGKISSNRDRLTLEMVPTPKVIDRLRKAAPAAMLVAFKLESGITPDELFARARRTMTRSGADFIVANLLEGLGTDAHAAYILGKDGTQEAVPTRRELAERIVLLLEERCRRDD